MVKTVQRSHKETGVQTLLGGHLGTKRKVRLYSDSTNKNPYRFTPLYHFFERWNYINTSEKLEIRNVTIECYKHLLDQESKSSNLDENPFSYD